MRKNLVPNGRARYTSGTVEVRRNLILNPLGDSSTGITGYSVVNDATVAFASGGGVRVTALVGGFRDSGVGFRSALGSLVVGQEYTISLDVVGEVEDSWGFRVESSLAGSLIVTTHVLVPVGEIRRLSVTFTAASATGGIYLLRSSPNVASQAVVRKVMCSTAGPYFDGSYSPDPDLTPSWTGTANASASVLSGKALTGLPSTGNAFAVQSTQWPDGGTSIRLIPRTSAVDSFVSVNGDMGAMRLGMVAGRPTAVRARGYLPSPQTGGFDVNLARNVTLYRRTSGAAGYTSTRGTQPPNVQGEFISEVVTTLPTDTTEAFVRLYNGASVGNGDVYWTDVIVAQADTESEALAAVQPFFDGDSGKTVLPTGFVVRRTWDGMPGESSSTEHDPEMGILSVQTDGSLPPRIVVASSMPVPSKSTWTLTGSSGDTSWPVRGGTGLWAAEQVAMLDPMCPVGVPVTYTLRARTSAGAVTTLSAGPVVRVSPSSMAVTSLDGRRMVRVRVLGSDEQAGQARVQRFDIPGARRPVLRLDTVSDATEGTLEWASTGSDTTMLSQLMAENMPLICLHDPSVCQIPDCDIPPVRLLMPLSWRHQRAGRIDVAERRWQVPWLEVDDPTPDQRVMPSTWDELDAINLLWPTLEGLSLTWDQFDLMSWATYTPGA